MSVMPPKPDINRRRRAAGNNTSDIPRPPIGRRRGIVSPCEKAALPCHKCIKYTCDVRWGSQWRRRKISGITLISALNGPHALIQIKSETSFGEWHSPGGGLLASPKKVDHWRTWEIYFRPIRLVLTPQTVRAKSCALSPPDRPRACGSAMGPSRHPIDSGPFLDELIYITTNIRRPS
jgi:hypothetical protein